MTWDPKLTDKDRIEGIYGQLKIQEHQINMLCRLVGIRPEVFYNECLREMMEKQTNE